MSTEIDKKKMESGKMCACVSVCVHGKKQRIKLITKLKSIVQRNALGKYDERHSRILTKTYRHR